MEESYPMIEVYLSMGGEPDLIKCLLICYIGLDSLMVFGFPNILIQDEPPHIKQSLMPWHADKDQVLTTWKWSYRG